MEQDFVEELCICEEYYQLPLDPETGEAAESPCKYHHIYLRTKDGQRYQYIKDILLAFTGKESWSINIQGCHSKISCANIYQRHTGVHFYTTCKCQICPFTPSPSIVRKLNIKQLRKSTRHTRSLSRLDSRTESVY
jgi:hypothetical protein